MILGGCTALFLGDLSFFGAVRLPGWNAGCWLLRSNARDGAPRGRTGGLVESVEVLEFVLDDEGREIPVGGVEYAGGILPGLGGLLLPNVGWEPFPAVVLVA